MSHALPYRESYGTSFFDILQKNWPRYNGTALYLYTDFLTMDRAISRWDLSRSMYANGPVMNVEHDLLFMS